MSTYYPVSGRTRVYSNKSYQPYQSVCRMKALNEFEFYKPGKLTNSDLSYSSLSSSELPENPFNSYTSFSMCQSRSHKQLPKENPFISTTPFRYFPKQQQRERAKGLSAWEKQKYLQMYAQNQPQQEMNGHSQMKNEKREPMALEGSKKTIRNKKSAQFQEVKIEGLLPYDEPNTGRFKKRNTLEMYEDDTISFKKTSPIDLKSKFKDVQTEEPQFQFATQNGQHKYYEEDPHQDKSQKSLIHKLSKGVVQPSPAIRMTNSRVFEYQYGNEQNSFHPENNTYQRAKDLKIQSGINVKIDDRYNFDENDRNTQKNDGIYINKKRDFPSSIKYKYVEYKMIKLI